METARLRLRPLEPGDEAALLALWREPAVAARLFPHAPATSAQARALVALRAGPMLRFALEDRAERAFLGYCGVQPLPETGEPELFYALHPRAWGRGLATEAGAAVLEAARAAGLSALVGVVLPSNAPSRRVLEKLGFRQAGTMQHAGREHLRFALSLR